MDKTMIIKKICSNRRNQVSIERIGDLCFMPVLNLPVKHMFHYDNLIKFYDLKIIFLRDRTLKFL